MNSLLTKHWWGDKIKQNKVFGANTEIIGEMKSALKVLMENLKGGNHLKDEM